MKILFIHKHLPGQFEHLMRALTREPSHEIVGIGQEFTPQHGRLDGVRAEIYCSECPGSAGPQGLLAATAEQVANGTAVAGRLARLKREGFVPDIAFAHPGWGESLYFKDVYPEVPLVGYCEFYYHGRGVDADFDPAFPLGFNDLIRIRTANAAQLLALVDMDLGISPTRWQRGLFPAEFQRKISVIHEGIDARRVRPDGNARFRLPNGRVLTRGQPVVTYATRNLEPYRGFPTFMRAVEEIGKRGLDCDVVIAGGDEVSYSAIGSEPFRQKLLREVRIDPNRVHFVGRLDYENYLKLLQVSSVHVYLTVPFVLSWSFLEAMAAGCVLVGSDTPPVREFLRHGENGLMADFFSPREVADMVERVLHHPAGEKELGRKAREDVVRACDAGHAVRRYRELIGRLLDSRQPALGAAG